MVLYSIILIAEMSTIDCFIYYGGVLEYTPSKGYVGGVCDELKGFDVDYLSVTHLRSHVKYKGFSEPERFLYKLRDDPFENTKDLLVDKDVMDIIEAMRDKKDVVLQIYAIHSVSNGDKGISNAVIDGGVEEASEQRKGKAKAKGKTKAKASRNGNGKGNRKETTKEK